MKEIKWQSQLDAEEEERIAHQIDGWIILISLVVVILIILGIIH